MYLVLHHYRDGRGRQRRFGKKRGLSFFVMYFNLNALRLFNIRFLRSQTINIWLVNGCDTDCVAVLDSVKDLHVLTGEELIEF